MTEIWLYTLVSVIGISLVSLIGIFTLGMQQERLERVLFYLISFSAGALLGDVFIHILPEIMQGQEALSVGTYVLAGIVLFFVLERVLLSHQSHTGHDERVHAVANLTIVGDTLHNLLDGIVIAASFMVSVPVGLATAAAVIFHEIPQEIGQYAILVHGGWSRAKALLYNFFSALAAILGAVLALAFGSLGDVPTVLLSLGAASFIYIALSDLVPELHKEHSARRSVIQLFWMLAGIGIMALLLAFD